MVQKEVKRKTRQYTVAAVLSALVLVSMVYIFGAAPIVFPSQAPFASAMKTFSSTQEIVNYLNTNSQSAVYGGGPLDNKFFGQRAAIPAPVTQGTGNFGSSSNEYAPQSTDLATTGSYSTTNVQVNGVDEADTVKTDGQYIYTASTSQSTYYLYDSFSQSQVNAVYILNADPANAKVVSKITLGNNTEPAGLFLSSDGNRLVVLASKYQIYAYSPRANVDAMMPMLLSYSSDVYTYINIYDVSNKADPVLTRNLTVSGSYFNSRMIGNNVYAVVSQPAVVYNNLVTLPTAYLDSNGNAVASPSSIYYADSNSSSFTFTSFYGVNIGDDTVQPTNMTVMMGGASTMYVSPSNMYITYPDYDQSSGAYTSIYRVAINGLQLNLQAEGSVPGNTINQYAMDEYNGYFRIATNWYGTDGQSNNVYVLNSDLNVTGKLEGLAPNENLHSVRFMGDKCYLVTFMKTDPLFVIDLSQPSSPRVLGELVIPGYSDYLHPYDETHLIGVGKDAADSGYSDFAWYQGIKVSLFDVSDVNNPAQLANFSIGDRGTDSPVLSDPKAFLFDKSKSLLVIPVSLAVVSEVDKQQYGASAYGQTVWQGAYVFSISVDGGLTLRGTVTHLDPSLLDSQGHIRNSNDYWSTQNSWITRSLYIGNVLYTVSSGEVKLSSLSDLSTIASVNLN
jgi:inhibitor of cysteine peptidase